MNLRLGIFLAFLGYVRGARILAVFPIGARSHYAAFEPMAFELVKRGHEITVISHFPYEPPVENLTVISTRDYLATLVSGIDINEVNKTSLPKRTFVEVWTLYNIIDQIARVFNVPGVQDLINSDKTFDLVIVEVFITDMFLGFAHKFSSPVIGLTASNVMTGTNARFANPDNPSYIPCISSSMRVPMTFYQRTYNTIQTLFTNLMYEFLFTQKSDFYARKYIGEDLPPLQNLVNNFSLLLFNSHHSLHGARPLVPNVIEIGGIHIQPSKTLPKDLQDYIDGAKHGVIYFCMGSMLKASTIPDSKRDALINAFKRLPQRVLWKWEDETMPGRPDNVKLLKWMPQRDVLAHPNVKLFISHGGLLGTTEAVHSGVPIIGIPFYGDQGVNIEAVASHGAGLRLDYDDITSESLYNTITEVLNNPKYTENAKSLSERFRDRPMSPLDTAVYWTEYVIRHKGAPHLRSAAVDLTWYQYLLLDVIAFILFVVVSVLALIYYSIKFIVKMCKPSKKGKSQKEKVKTS